jgi:hypothetical protein
MAHGLCGLLDKFDFLFNNGVRSGFFETYRTNGFVGERQQARHPRDRGARRISEIIGRATYG